jgi:hypothetical protein
MGSPAAGNMTTEIAIKTARIVRITAIPELSDQAAPASTGDLVDMGDNLDGVVGRNRGERERCAIGMCAGRQAVKVECKSPFAIRRFAIRRSSISR